MTSRNVVSTSVAALFLAATCWAQTSTAPAKQVQLGDKVTIRIVYRDGTTLKVTGILRGVDGDYVLIDDRGFHRDDIHEPDWDRIKYALPTAATQVTAGTEGRIGYGVFAIPLLIILFCLLFLGRDLLRFLIGDGDGLTEDNDDQWGRPDPEWGTNISEEKRIDLSYDLAVLELCIGELETRAEVEGKHQWSWQTKLKVARLLASQLRNRIDWEWEESFTDEDKAEILAEHPLLTPTSGPPPDMTKDYTDQDWYRDIRAKVERYVASRRSSK